MKNLRLDVSHVAEGEKWAGVRGPNVLVAAQIDQVPYYGSGRNVREALNQFLDVLSDHGAPVPGEVVGRLDDLERFADMERLRNLDEALREFIEPKVSGPTAFVRELKRTGAWTGLAESLAEKLGEARRSERKLKTEVKRLEAEIVDITNRWQGDIER